MDHKDIEELLSAYANGELANTQREFVEGHLSSCSDCRSKLASFTWVRHQLIPLSEVPIKTDIMETTMARINSLSVTRRPAIRFRRPALVAAPILALLAIMVLLNLPGTGLNAPIAKAYATTASLQSFRMAGTTTSTFDGERGEVTFEWEFAASDRYHGVMVTDGQAQEFIAIGDMQYIRDSNNNLSSETVIVTDSLFSPIPSREGVLKLLDSLTALEELPDQEINGVDSFHYSGRVDIDKIFDEQLATLDPESPAYEEAIEVLELQRGITIDVELWASKEDFSIQQMQVNGRVPTIGSGPEGYELIGSLSFSTMVRYSGFNEIIEIEPPLTESGNPEPGWRLAGSAPAPVIEKETITP